MVFPVVMYGCESWTIKEAEHQRTDAFKQWCWRRLLRVPWTARRYNQSILKEINPEYSLERLMLKLQYFGHQMWRADLDAGKDWGQEEKGMTEEKVVGWHHWLNGHEISKLIMSWWWTGRPGVLQSTGSQRVRHDLATTPNTLKSIDLSRVISSPAFTQSSSLHRLVRLHCQHLAFSSIRLSSNSGGLWCQDQGLASFLREGPDCNYFKFWGR